MGKKLIFVNKKQSESRNHRGQGSIHEFIERTQK